MKRKMTLAALALMLAPGAALAMGCAHDSVKETTASTCVDGAVWDEATGACVPTTTS
jgi:hypothetical protein